jgi:N-acetylglutamate synthase
MIQEMEIIHYRKMTLEDYPMVRELWLSVEGLHLSENDSEPSLRRFLEKNPELCWVAYVSGKLAGTILSGHDGRWGIVRHLAVVSEWRRKGIGTKLLSLCCETLKELWYTTIVAFIYPSNNEAIEFWKRHGFVRYESAPFGLSIK